MEQLEEKLDNTQTDLWEMEQKTRKKVQQKNQYYEKEIEQLQKIIDNKQNKLDNTKNNLIKMEQKIRKILQGRDYHHHQEIVCPPLCIKNVCPPPLYKKSL